MKEPLQVILPLEEFDTPCVPSNLYGHSLDDIIEFAFVKITEKDLVAPSKYGKTTVYLSPELNVIFTEMKKAFKIINQRNFFATVYPYGLSIFQHEFNPQLKIIKNNRTQMFYGDKYEIVVELYGSGHHLFEKLPKGSLRKEKNIFGNRDEVIAPVNENAEFFNVSNSDLSQVILCGVALKWDKLPDKPKKFCSNMIDGFRSHARRYLDMND